MIKKDRLNHMAYDDCCEFREPQLPSNETYMECYRFWRQLTRFPEDEKSYEPF